MNIRLRVGGCTTDLSFFWGGKKIPKNGRDNIFRSGLEISKVLKFLFGLENICMLLYTTSDYYGKIVGAKGDILAFLKRAPLLK